MARPRPSRRISPVALVAIGALVFGASCGAPKSAEESTPEPAEGPFSERGYASTDRLVTTQWVADHLDDPAVLVVDLRRREAYDTGHVPGAVHLEPRDAFHAEDDRGVPGMIPGAKTLGETLGAIGATPTTTVVFYDDEGNRRSARGVWVLSVYRHADVRIMDGAWRTWNAENRPVETESRDPVPASYVFEDRPDTSIIASWKDVVAAIDDPETLVCDTRSEAEYAGTDVRAARGGHVPGALNVEWSRAVDSLGAFLPAGELRTLYADTGVTDGKTTFTMCQSGVRASHTWFVLTDLLGFDDVRVYDGSWVEYGNRDDSPIEESTPVAS